MTRQQWADIALTAATLAVVALWVLNLTRYET